MAVTSQRENMNQFTDLDLLLIGKSGHGKSATGNNILGRKAFLTTGSASSVTQEIAYEVSDVKGRIIKVVDGPGVCDNRHDTESAVKRVMDAMENAISTNPKGYHAFLLVLKYGQRFTGEEQDAVKFLKTIFGADFVKDFCVLVMTGGDTFEQENEDAEVTFQEWCSLQEGEFKNLLAECGNRIVLFNNMTQETSARDRSLNRLIYLVDQLRSNGQPYTDANFEKAHEQRKRVLLEAKEPLIRDEVIQETSLILQRLEVIQNSSDEADRHEAFERLMKRAGALHERLSALDKGTNVLHELFPVVKSIQSTISAEIKCNIRIKEEQKLHVNDLEEVKKEAGEEIEGLRKTIQSDLAEKSSEESLTEREAELEGLKARRIKEIDGFEKKYIKKMKEERLKLKREAGQLEKMYREIKEKSDLDILTKIVTGITLPLRATAKIFLFGFKAPILIAEITMDKG